MTGAAFLQTRNLVGTAHPHMRRLMEEYEETINLAIEDEEEAFHLAPAECRQMMRAFARPGGRAFRTSVSRCWAGWCMTGRTRSRRN